jgi:hypothetical protein
VAVEEEAVAVDAVAVAVEVAAETTDEEIEATTVRIPERRTVTIAVRPAISRPTATSGLKRRTSYTVVIVTKTDTTRERVSSSNPI